MYGGYDLNSFKKGIKLTKEYILGRMQGNPIYGQYLPDNVNPIKITRGFLLTVINIIKSFLVNSIYWYGFIQGIIRNSEITIRSTKKC